MWLASAKKSESPAYLGFVLAEQRAGNGFVRQTLVVSIRPLSVRQRTCPPPARGTSALSKSMDSEALTSIPVLSLQTEAR